jgi:RNA polymerase sigma factor (sigma-70 family)
MFRFEPTWSLCVREPPLHTLLDHLRRIAGAPGADMPQDGELLRRFVQQRDSAAFELLIWRHGPMVLSVCRRILPDSHLAEDAFQATFLTLVRKAAGIAKREAVAGWLYKVAYHIALRARGTLAKRASREIPCEDYAQPDIGQSNFEDDWRPILDEEIHRLPAKYRLPVVLCHLQGRTLADAARSLGCPRGTVAVRLMRGRERLRARLIRRGVVLSAGLSTSLASHHAVSAAQTRSTVQIALAQLGGRSAVTAAIPKSILSLTEGALHAMFMSKIKVIAAVLAAALIASGGAGWLSRHLAAGEVAPTRAVAREEGSALPLGIGGQPAIQASPPKDNAVEQRRPQRNRQLLLAVEEHRNLQMQVATAEKDSTPRLIAARLKMLERKDALQRLEEELQFQVKSAREQEAKRRALMDADEEQLFGLRRKLETTMQGVSEMHPEVLGLKKEMVLIQEYLKGRLKNLEHVTKKSREREEELRENIRKARADFLQADEDLRYLQRDLERAVGVLERDMESQAQLVWQLQKALNQEDMTPARAPDQRLDSLERKMEQLLRELKALRKDSKRSLDEP